jgi:ankyrin repeat protein
MLMKSKLIFAICSLLIAAAGCGRSPDSARKQLAELRQDFTPDNFVMAAVHGDAKVVELFITAGMDVNISPDNGMSALIGASGEGNLDVVRLLIQKSAKVDAKNNEAGVTALLLAAANGKDDAVKLLVQSGANINETDNDGDTPLLQAVAKGHVQIVKFLLGNHADPNVENVKGLTAFDCTDNTEINQLLRDAGARKFTDQAFWTFLKQQQAQNWNESLNEAKNFVRNGGDPAQAFSRSRKMFSPETVAEYKATGMSSAQISYMQLAALSAIENAGYTGTMFSSTTNAQQEAELNKLASDCFSAYTNAFNIFVNDPKADLNWKDWRGMTFLMNTSMRGQTELVKALIAKRANLNLQSNEGKTAADYAQENKCTDIVALLRAAGADVQPAN